MNISLKCSGTACSCCEHANGRAVYNSDVPAGANLTFIHTHAAPSNPPMGLMDCHPAKYFSFESKLKHLWLRCVTRRFFEIFQPFFAQNIQNPYFHLSMYEKCFLWITGRFFLIIIFVKSELKGFWARWHRLAREDSRRRCTEEDQNKSIKEDWKKKLKGLKHKED